jgi:excisionase family DNA binding protein
MTARVWSAAELAERWGCSVWNVEAMCRDGRLRAFKAGSRWRVHDHIVYEYETGRTAEVAS